jgi:hypothetical protein
MCSPVGNVLPVEKMPLCALLCLLKHALVFRMCQSVQNLFNVFLCAFLFRICFLVQNVPLCSECANFQVLEETREKVLDLYTGKTTLFLFYAKITIHRSKMHWTTISLQIVFKKLAVTKE